MVSACGTPAADPDVCPAASRGYLLFYPAAICLGLMDCAFQSQAQAVCASAFAGREAEAFALYRTVQAATNFILFIVTPLLSMEGGYVADRRGLSIELLLLLGTTAVGLVTWAIFEHGQKPK